jgi:hypothetical protein
MIWAKLRDRRPMVEWLIVIAVAMALPVLRPAHGETRPTQPNPSAASVDAASVDATSVDPAPVDPAPVDCGGWLFRTVLSGAWEHIARPRPDAERLLPAETQARLQQFQTRGKHVRSRIAHVPGPDTQDPDKDPYFSRVSTERTLVALFEGPGVASEAAAYARRAPFWYEYESDPKGPRTEIAYARAWMKTHPTTRFAPFLWLGIAYRERVLFEIYGERKDPVGQQTAAREYREALARTRASGNPLFRAAADDLDLQPDIYLPVPKGAPPPPHPGTFR